jgi:hypothetical protein
MCGDRAISNPTKKHNRASLKKVVSIIATSFAMFIALFSIISVFFVGTKNGSAYTYDNQFVEYLFSIGNSLPKGNVYYFLVGIHVDWAQSVASMQNFSWQYAVVTLLSNVILSHVVLAALAFTLIFGIKAIIAGIDALKSKSYVAPLKLAVKSALSYLLGVVAVLFVFSRQYYVLDEDGVATSSMGGGLNRYSHVAVVVTIIAVAMLITCYLVVNSSAIYKKQNLLMLIFTKAKILLVALILPCLLASMANMVMFQTKYFDRVLVTQASPLNLFIELCNFQNLVQSNAVQNDTAYIVALIGAIVALFATLATIVVCGKLLANRIKNLTEVSTDKGLLGAILLSAFVLVIVVVTCILPAYMHQIQYDLLKYGHTSQWISFHSYNLAIVFGLVLALHYLGVVVAERIIANKRSKVIVCADGQQQFDSNVQN